VANPDMNAADNILSAIANRECKRLAEKVIHHLEEMTDCMQSGDDSPLVNVWEEICTQVQGQESTMWDIYLDTIQQIVLGFVEKLDRETKSAIWLQTQTGEEWETRRRDDDGVIPWSDEDIAEHVLHKYVLSAAADYTNARIEKYLEREFD
jgi:hypothetical protein